MHMPEDDVGVAPAHSRYRALLDVSAALVEQPTVKAVLHSLREVLSSSLRLHGADLYLLDSGRETLHLLEFDRAVDAPTIRIGTKISRIGAAAQALDQKEPVFLPDVSEEMLKHPELAPFAAQSSGRSTYVFPLFTCSSPKPPPTLSLAAVTLLRRRFWRRIGYGPWMNSPWGVVWTPRDFGEYKQFHPRRQFRVNRDRNILLPSLESDIP